MKPGYPNRDGLLSTAVEVKVNLRPTVSRPVCLGVGHPSGTRDQFLSHSLKFSSESCGFVIL
jgi:hypothetical protein